MITEQDLLDLRIDPAKPIRIEKVATPAAMSEYDQKRALYTYKSLFEFPNGERFQAYGRDKEGRRNVILCKKENGSCCYLYDSQVFKGVKAGTIKVLSK